MNSLLNPEHNNETMDDILKSLINELIEELHTKNAD
jgi:hypothetical protein